MVNKYIELLGLDAEDLVTGSKGIITSVTFDLYGCIQVILTPASTDTDKESKWFDVSRLRILNNVPVMPAPNFSVGEVAGGKKGGFEKPIPGKKV